MIAEMYKRRERLALIIFFLTLIISGLFLLFNMPNTMNEWFEFSSILLLLLFMITIAGISRSKYEKVKDVAFPFSEQTLESMDHIVLKKDATFIPRLLVFEKTGEFLGTFQLTGLSWWQYPLLLNEAFLSLLPIKMSFVTYQGDKVLTFKRRGIIKQTFLDVYDENDQFIGQYHQEELKSIFTIKGKLLDQNGQLILPVKASGAYGDFDICDQENHRWAYFYNGRFPHEYTAVFKELDNDIIELSNQIDSEKKKLLLAMIAYMFSTRQK
ncbi:hypothetical protein SH601_07505 [Gracilibacillus sp. S3-1-1]|uniref:Uncharacterized protein n=1 Tax=Gracilibacillus pellucidus TaxID=3095368 RepID=A0ACC6M4E3_9BACI|nr:hypothetical protein [Gracilibacillus sp. S3-1-1]MDX8045835.1 hypothetical protein [Gracilibacillus sp. S3-1-1]